MKDTKKNSGAGKDMILKAAQSCTGGEIELIWEPEKNAERYLIQKTTGSLKPGKWKYEDIVDKTKYTATHLVSKKIYWFRIAAISGNRKPNWSLPVHKRAP